MIILTRGKNIFRIERLHLRLVWSAAKNQSDNMRLLVFIFYCLLFQLSSTFSQNAGVSDFVFLKPYLLPVVFTKNFALNYFDDCGQNVV